MARRFHFPLATLLKVRELREREAKRKVAMQQAGIARLDRLNELTWQEILTQQAALREAQERGRVEPAELARGRAWIAHLRGTIAQRQAQRGEMVKRLEQLQADFREARKQTRIIQKLRERRQDQYRRELKRREQAATAELAQHLHLLAQTEAAGAPPPRGMAAGGLPVGAASDAGGTPADAE